MSTAIEWNSNLMSLINNLMNYHCNQINRFMITTNFEMIS